MMAMDFDDALKHLGEIGTYQWRMFFIVCFPACLFSTFAVFSHIFISAIPNHHCRLPKLTESVNHSLLNTLASPTELREAMKSLFIPWDSSKGQFDSCLQYQVNATEVIDILGSSIMTPINASYIKSFMKQQQWSTSSCSNGWIYDRTIYEETLATKFNIVCDQEWLSSLSQSLFFIGATLGTVLCGFIADKFGRRFAFLLGNGLLIVTGCVGIVTPNYEIYIVLRFLSGLTYTSIYQLSFVIVVEMIGVSWRATIAMCLAIVYGIAMMIMAVIASMFPHWRHLQAVFWLPGILLASYYWIIPESPRWLISQRRFDEAEQIVQKMAIVNGKLVPKNFLKFIMASKETTMNDLTSSKVIKTTEVEASFEVRHLLKYPKTLWRIIITSFIWFSVSSVYNGTTFEVPALASSEYTAFFMSGLVEIPGIVLAWILVNRIGRRPTMFASTFIGGGLCFGTAFIPQDLQWLREAMPTMSKLAISAAFAVMYMYAGELFPTVIRGFVLGCAATLSAVGLVLLPSILFLGNVYGEEVPFIILGISGMIGALLVLPLPETINKHLPATLEEAENSHRTSNQIIVKKNLFTDSVNVNTGNQIIERF